MKMMKKIIMMNSAFCGGNAMKIKGGSDRKVQVLPCGNQIRVCRRLADGYY